MRFSIAVFSTAAAALLREHFAHANTAEPFISVWLWPELREPSNRRDR